MQGARGMMKDATPFKVIAFASVFLGGILLWCIIVLTAYLLVSSICS